MITEHNKAIARRFIEEILGKGNLALLDELTTRTYVDHNLPNGITPAQSIGAFRAGFPDVQATVEDVIAEGEKVVVRYTLRGTHTGVFFGMPPTGIRVIMTGISIYLIVDGKLEEGWVEYDQLGLMQQLGALPAPGRPTAV